VQAVIAESFERIHRSNLVGMGILPMQFTAGTSVSTLGLSGKERFTIEGIPENLAIGSEHTVVSEREDGSQVRFQVIARINTELELEYYRNGGIMQTVLVKLLSETQPAE
jgi:aconitate hydratase